jgi:hypothetical protein
MKLPPPPKISARTIVQKAPPPPPADIPPQTIPETPRIPAYTPPPPDVVPVDVVPVPVAVAPVAELPLLPPPPLAPPVPAVTPAAPVLFTSSADRVTQAVTLIVLFMACGCWIYGNRITSQMNVRKREHVAAGA